MHNFMQAMNPAWHKPLAQQQCEEIVIAGSLTIAGGSVRSPLARKRPTWGPAPTGRFPEVRPFTRFISSRKIESRLW
jgi:hypothetical protein